MTTETEFLAGLSCRSVTCDLADKKGLLVDDLVKHTNMLLDVSDEVFKESLRQVELWGIQKHSDGTGPDEGLVVPEGGVVAYSDLVDIYTELCNTAKELTYADILLEEVFEALQESDTDLLREELIQVAAVALSWVVKLDRGE